jgi:hypothetical protein
MRVLDRVREVRRTSRRRRMLALAAMAGMAGALVTVSPASAGPGVLPENLQKYGNCPVSNPDVRTCVYVKADNLQMKLGSFDLESSDPIILEFGLKFAPGTTIPIVVPPVADDINSIMTASPIEVPGGITGIPGAGVGPLAAYATPSLTSLPKVNLTNLRTGLGPAFELDLRAKISNPFTDFLTILGTKCHVGSASDPISLKLTTGTTNPPPPNTPISGQFNPTDPTGQPVSGFHFPDIVTVDNAFRAPGAHDCGLTGFLNGVINLQGDLPSAAGTNTARMTSDVYQVGAPIVRSTLAGERVVNGGFEAGMAPWACAGSCGVDEGLGNARTGSNNGWVRKNSGWNDLHQTISVARDTNYTLSGWIRTSANNANGYFGVRKPGGGAVVKEKKYGNYPGYTQVTVSFNSGTNSTLEVFGGLWASGDTWAQFDDISLIAD